LAQVLEKENSKKEALKESKHCVVNGQDLELAKIKWVELAGQRLKELKAKG
jgi:hypothetical protein